MVFRVIERSYEASVVSSFGESMTGSIELPRDRRISEIVLQITALVANDTTSQTMTKRQLFSILDNITLKVNGAVGNINVEGARYYDFITALTGHEPLVLQDDIPIADGGTLNPTNSTNTTYQFFVPFYFRKNMKNPYDVSGLLDAFAMSSLRLEFTTRAGWAPADANLTITEASSNARCYLKEVQVDDETLKALNAANGEGNTFYNVFYLQTQDKLISTSTGYANSIDLQTSYIYQQIMIHSYDNSAVEWANDIVDAIRIRQISPAGDVDFIDVRWEASQAEDAMWADCHVVPKGATMWDCDSKLGGLDARAMKTGDLKLYYNSGATIQTGVDAIDLLYKALVPVRL
jgi:hypothetical protein